MNVTIRQAKAQLSKLIEDALHGEEVIITNGKTPVVKITPLPGAVPERKLGGASGIVEFMSPDLDDQNRDFEAV